MKALSLIVLPVVLLSGCVASTSTTDPLSSSKKIDKAAQVKTPADRVGECTRELEALKSFNPQAYTKYQAEFDKIRQETERYLGVKDKVSDDINYLAMPKYQFSLRNVCFRIKTDLSNSIIKQV